MEIYRNPWESKNTQDKDALKNLQIYRCRIAAKARRSPPYDASVGNLKKMENGLGSEIDRDSANWRFSNPIWNLADHARHQRDDGPGEKHRVPSVDID